MKKIVSIGTLLLILMLTFALPVFAQEGDDDGQVVFGGEFKLRSGETLNNNLVIFGGDAELEENSVVNGDVTVFGGDVKIGGQINGDLMVFGGSAELEDKAVVNGDLSFVGGSLNRDEDAIVRGKVESVSGGENFSDCGPKIMPRSGGSAPAPLRFVRNIFEGIVLVLVSMAVGLLVALFLPRQTDLTARTMSQYPLLSFGIGFLSLVFGSIIGGIMSLICVGIFVLLALCVAVIFGWIAVGYLAGQRLGGMFSKTWSPVAACAVGVGFMTLLTYVPCVGPIFFGLALSTGLGAVILSRFGTTPYIPSKPSSTGSSTPPAAPSSGPSTPAAPSAPPTPPASTPAAPSTPPASTPAAPSAPPTPPPANPSSSREAQEHPETDIPEDWEVV